MADCIKCGKDTDLTIGKTRDEVEQLGVDEITETLRDGDNFTSFSMCDDCREEHL
jgi:hypothetical protein